jgi:multimeric flavodoxin WrbA
MRGAREAGNEVEKIRVAEKKVGYCTACYYCQKSGGECAIRDDMGEILRKMIDADVILLSSPVYFYSIGAQLKAVIDRTVARWTEVRDKEFYYIATCADEGRGSLERTIECFRGYADCVEGAVERGIVYGTGVYQKGEVDGTPAMDEAYRMGLGVR